MLVRSVRYLSAVVSVCAAVVALGLSIPTVARASCQEPKLALLWSYPADGSDNVPTNALLWALSSNWAAPRATLDGVALPIPDEGVQGVPMGALAPQRDYVLRLDYGPGWQVDAGGPRVFEIRFRTGAGPAAQPPAVPVLGVERANGIGPSACTDVVSAQDCFDTGQNTLVTFDVSDANAIGWRVGNEIWPARCGRPALYVHPERLRHCFPISAIGVGGLRSVEAEYCPASLDAGGPMHAPSPSVDEPSGPPPARAAADAGASKLDSGDAARRPAADSPNTAPEGSCSAAPERAAGRTQLWLLLLVGATLFARARRSRTRQ